MGIQYVPTHFASLFESDLGQRLWKFLNRQDNFLRMETAAKLSRAAVEPLSDLLLEEFGGAVRDDRVKQMIGHMVRQVMESHGYHLDAQNALVRFGGLFTRGSRYAK